MSFDPPATNAGWADVQKFQYELWTDTDKTLATYYGANGFMPKRVTRILDAQGKLIVVYNNVDATLMNHVQNVLDDCNLLFGN